MNNNSGRAYLRGMALCTLAFLTHPRAEAQITPRDTSAAYRPICNGRDAVIGRPGDSPYSLHHLSRPYPRTRRLPKEICYYYGLYSGMWIPTGRDRVLGSPSLLGASFGQWINRFM